MNFMDESIIGCKSDKWEKRKEYLDDPEKPHGYLVSVSGWIPGDKLNGV